MNADIEQDIAAAIAAQAVADNASLTARAWTVDDSPSDVEEAVAFPSLAVIVGPALEHEPGDVLFQCGVRLILGTHHTVDRKGTSLATHLKALRDTLEDITSIDDRIPGNIRLLGLVWPDDPAERCRSFIPGGVPELPGWQGYELNLTAAVAACDETTTTTTTTTTTAP